MEQIYGEIYDKKRLAPGGVTRVEQTASGTTARRSAAIPARSWSISTRARRSACISAAASSPTNYAVRADVVKEMLGDVRAGRAARKARGAAPASSAPTMPLATPGRPGSPARAAGTREHHDPADFNGVARPSIATARSAPSADPAARRRPAPCRTS